MKLSRCAPTPTRLYCTPRVNAVYIQDPSVLAFLLTNLIPAEGGTLKFRLPVDLLIESIPEIGSFPYAPGERKWSRSALFVKGTKSKCVIAFVSHLQDTGSNYAQ